MKPMIIAFLLPLLVALNAAGLDRPNVLFIAVDDLRPELGCYGSTLAQTPHIDKLAGQGMRFDRAYCQVPVCGASRACLMTSILPTPKRFLNADVRVDREAPGVATLPQLFKEAGYTTLSNGKIFHHPEDTGERSWSEPAWKPAHRINGLDPETVRFLSEKKRGRIFESPDVSDDSYADGKMAAKTIADLQRLKQQGKPFFLACGFIKPHMPFYAPKKYWDLYERKKIQVANNRERPMSAPKDLKGSSEFRSYHLAGFDENSEDFHRLMRHGYLACTSYTDKLVGDVLAEIDRLQLAENTIVVLWGDHGWHLGEHNFWGKHNTMHLSTRIPLIIRVPGKKADRTSALVETIDIFPTLCALAGIKLPDTVQGREFTKLFDQPNASFREAVYSRFGKGDAIITEHFTYTSYGKTDMLYDIRKDPQENINIADDTANTETVAGIVSMLKTRKLEAAKFEKN